MKKMLIILSASIALCSCSKRDEFSVNSTSITVLVDETDPLVVLPDADALLKLCHLAENKTKAVRFKIGGITDMQLNPNNQIRLENDSMTEAKNIQDDPFYREQLVLHFYDQVRTLVSTFIADTAKSLGSSECFIGIAKELSEFQKEKGEKILVIYSDLQENSQLFNCYAQPEQQLLQSNPQKVVARFERAGRLPDDLRGVTVFFVYAPKTRLEDQKFSSMVSVYSQLLHTRHADAKVIANNEFNE